MRFAYSWLLDCLDTECSAQVLVDKLSSIGVEAALVEGGVKQGSFVVAKVLEVLAHPDAHKLKVCKVYDGVEILQIVCGASNVRSGMITVLARVGAYIQESGITISKAVIRGVESSGMLCSLEELGMSSSGDPSSGIVDLSESSEYAVGEDFIPREEIIEVSVTPNRGDCLGVYGIARELAAAGMGSLKGLPVVGGDAALCKPSFTLDMRVDGLIMGCSIKSISNKSASPRWIRERLLAAGVKTVSCVVDIVNYVMMLLNRPMHVYDADKIKDAALIVEKVARGECIAINGKKYELAGDVVIRDADGIVHCIAGIMGSEQSKCTSDTENVFIESAWYDPVDIALSSRRLKLNTDSSYRFARYVDPKLVGFGLNYAAYLISKYCGGEVSEVVISGSAPDKAAHIEFDPEIVSKIGSVSIDRERILSILESLGFVIDVASGELWRVEVPSWRNDVSSPHDLVEEVLRIHGYDAIQEQEVLPARVLERKANAVDDSLNNRVRASMLSQGLTEVITWSFLAGAVVEKMGFSVEDLYIDNPISNQFNVMRPSVLPNLLQVVSNNQACGRDSISVYELGDVYIALDRSDCVVCGVRAGNDLPRNPHASIRKFDFFDVKADIEQVFLQFGISEADLEFRASTRDYLHPSRSADVYCQGLLCGYVGELHPSFVEFFELKDKVACFEVFLSGLSGQEEKARGGFFLNKYQVVKRDFAFILDKEIKARELVTVIKAVRYVEDVSVFDVYSGVNIPEGKVSIAVAVVITSGLGTMTEAEIKEVSDSIIESVKRELHGQLRLESA